MRLNALKIKYDKNTYNMHEVVIAELEKLQDQEIGTFLEHSFKYSKPFLKASSFF